MDALLGLMVGTSPFHAELRTFGMAFQGAMAVRNGKNKDKSMDWFYAYCCTLLAAFAGGMFGFMWMGKPTSLITGGDVTLTLTAVAFVLATYIPMDIGCRLGNNIVVKIITTVFAQLFRALGMLAFINTATAEVSASNYYPTPILGPVLYGVLLGNMGGVFSKGFDGHLNSGMPFPVQNGKYRKAKLVQLIKLTPTISWSKILEFCIHRYLSSSAVAILNIFYSCRCHSWIPLPDLCQRPRRNHGTNSSINSSVHWHSKGHGNYGRQGLCHLLGQSIHGC